MTQKTSPKCPSALPAGQNVARPVHPVPLQDRADTAAVLPPQKARAVRRDRRRKLRLARARALPRNRRRKNQAAREERLRKNRPRKRRAARKRNASFVVHPRHCSRKEVRYVRAFLFWVSNAARSSFICPQCGPHRQDRLIDLGNIPLAGNACLAGAGSRICYSNVIQRSRFS